MSVYNTWKCINTLAKWPTLLQYLAVIYWDRLNNLLWFNSVFLNWFYNCSANLLNFITNDYTKLLYAVLANMYLWSYPEPTSLQWLFNWIWQYDVSVIEIPERNALKIYDKYKITFVTKFWLCDRMRNKTEFK